MTEISRKISVRGAREHNLNNINLDIPRDKLIVFTGLSGNGTVQLGISLSLVEAVEAVVQAYHLLLLQYQDKITFQQIVEQIH